MAPRADLQARNRILAFSQARAATPPVGQRVRVTSSALADDFDTHGTDVIAKVRESRPHECLRVIASALPKRLETEPYDRPLELLTDEELTRIIRDSEQALRDNGSVNGGER